MIIQNSQTGITKLGLMSYSEILNRFMKAIPRSIGRCSLNANPENEPVSGVIRNEQEIGFSAIELMSSMIERNIMGLPNHTKVLTILSDWYEGETLPKRAH